MPIVLKKANRTCSSPLKPHFSAIVLAQAAKQLGRTPSAISLQMKSLQEDLGMSLFRKRGRDLALTEAGEVALAYAAVFSR